MLQELSKLKDLLEAKVLIPVYPSLGSTGGGSAAELNLERAWEAKYVHRRKEYEDQKEVRQQLSVCFASAHAELADEKKRTEELIRRLRAAREYITNLEVLAFVDEVLPRDDEHPSIGEAVASLTGVERADIRA